MKKYPIFNLLTALILALASISPAALTYAQSEAQITLADDASSISGEGVSIDGNTITVTQAGTYSLSGSLSDGQLLVDTQDAGTVTLILDGVDITNQTNAPVYVKNAAEVVIVLADGSENHLTDAAEYTYASDDDDPNAAVYSNAALVIQGNGSLTINGNYDDALKSRATITINDAPTLIINATVDKTIKVDDSVTINGGTITLNAADDGINADQDFTLNAGTLTINSGDDAIHAEYNIVINGGLIDIQSSVEGIEAGFITINDGDIHIIASDDAINVSVPEDAQTTTDTTTAQVPAEMPPMGEFSGGQPPQGGGFGGGQPPRGQGQMPMGGRLLDTPYYLRINGGYLVIDAEGDGLDSNGSMEINGGIVIINGTTSNMDGALDSDGIFTLDGGMVVAVGSAAMPQMPNDTSTQPTVLVVFDTQLSAGTLINIQTSAGESLLTFAPKKDFQSLIFSSNQLSIGETYTISYGGTSSASVTDGLYEAGEYSGGTQSATITIDGILTQIGNIRRR